MVILKTKCIHIFPNSMENYLSYLSYLSISFEEKKDFWRKMLNRGSFFTHEIKKHHKTTFLVIFSVQTITISGIVFFTKGRFGKLAVYFKRLLERFQKIHIKQSEEYKSPSKEFLIHLIKIMKRDFLSVKILNSSLLILNYAHISTLQK